MNHALDPGAADVRQFVGHAASTFTKAAASRNGRAIEIARAVERDAFVRFTSIGSAGKTVEHGVDPAIARR